MNKSIVFAIALLVALIVTLGVYATTKSAQLGPSSSPQSNVAATVAQGNQRLNTIQASLTQALSTKPPRASGGTLPYVAPKVVVVNVTGSSSATPYAIQVIHQGGEEND